MHFSMKSNGFQMVPKKPIGVNWRSPINSEIPMNMKSQMNMATSVGMNLKRKRSEDSYEVTEEVVHKEQVDRLVQKALQREKKL